MSKINLSQEEVALIHKHLEGRFDPFTAKEEDQRMMNNIINKASNLEDELDAYEEVMLEPECDLLRWYLKKYNEQGK